MDLCLIAAGWTDPRNWIAGLEVLIALGFVIFVHELGHFTVAKMCGVKVDKFLVGFDIFGWRLLSFRWGETLYGIGILPLGGYVKMLGQEDNPAQLRKEMERAKQEAAAASSAAGGETSGRAFAASELSDNGDSPAEKRLFDPRSYLAKSVPQRMAIISAGVIMNMIFAVVFAVIAFAFFGVKDQPTIVGVVMPGGAAWQAGVQPDDEVLEVAGRRVHSFRRMTEEIINGDAEHGIPLLIRRAGIENPLEIVVKPQQLLGRPTIGIGSTSELVLAKDKDSIPFEPESAAANAKGPFLPGDRIIQINGHPIGSYGQLQSSLVAHGADELTVTVARSRNAGAQVATQGETENVQVTVPTSPVKQFGLIMEMGPISAVQTQSPAAEAGIQAGDLLKTIDGKAVADPMRLPEELHSAFLHGRAGAEIELGLERDGKTLTVKVKPSGSPRYAPAAMPDSPVAISELGIAYYVLSTVSHVGQGSPAAEAGLQAGDRITKATIVPPSKEQLDAINGKYHIDDLGQNEVTLPLSENERNWPCLMYILQGGLPGTMVDLTWRRGDKEMSHKIAPAADKDWFDSQRGFNLEPMLIVQRADSFSQALQMGVQETIAATSVVYRNLHSVGTNKISVRNFSGPLGIISLAVQQARLGLGNLLVFLTLLSANLAVINFLPIPLLDGGHMVLLLYEGIRGKPADERVQEILTWIGLILILSLMVFVFGLDLGWISRPGAH